MSKVTTVLLHRAKTDHRRVQRKVSYHPTEMWDRWAGCSLDHHVPDVTQPRRELAKPTEPHGAESVCKTTTRATQVGDCRKKIKTQRMHKAVCLVPTREQRERGNVRHQSAKTTLTDESVAENDDVSCTPTVEGVRDTPQPRCMYAAPSRERQRPDNGSWKLDDKEKDHEEAITW